MEEFKNHESIRKLISRIFPGFEPISNIGKTKKEFTSVDVFYGGQFLHSFPVKLNLFIIYSKSQSIKRKRISFIDCASEGQFNTVVYEEEDIYRGQKHRNVVLMNRKDMDRIGLVENDQVGF
ncbi:MAG: hypothetical protein Ct9H300mP29_1430 [Candidatus Neomarinimicrobiota bacterium]|nr:MAG: hypothetical protein Ct9H300mP29_1430 [Candidatus Neomarinimicrobiota bacterium]